MVDARSYVTTQQQTQTQQMTKDASDLQRRAVDIAAESMAALFAPKRVRLDVKGEPMGISGKEAAPSSVVVDDKHVHVQESALKRLRVSDAEEERQCAGGGACPRRSPGSDPDLESDGASSSAPEQRKTPRQSEQPARKVRVRKPTYAVRKVRVSICTESDYRYIIIGSHA